MAGIQLNQGLTHVDMVLFMLDTCFDLMKQNIDSQPLRRVIEEYKEGHIRRDRLKDRSEVQAAINSLNVLIPEEKQAATRPEFDLLHREVNTLLLNGRAGSPGGHDAALEEPAAAGGIGVFSEGEGTPGRRWGERWAAGARRAAMPRLWCAPQRVRSRSAWRHCWRSAWSGPCQPPLGPTSSASRTRQCL
eukprot:765814-Hanusia_phi.AAC.6